MPKNGGLGQARAQVAKIWGPEPLGPIQVYVYGYRGCWEFDRKESPILSSISTVVQSLWRLNRLKATVEAWKVHSFSLIDGVCLKQSKDIECQRQNGYMSPDSCKRRHEVLWPWSWEVIKPRFRWSLINYFYFKMSMFVEEFRQTGVISFVEVRMRGKKIMWDKRRKTAPIKMRIINAISVTECDLGRGVGVGW